MKKLMAVLVSTLMLVSFAATAMAAPSPTADVKVTQATVVINGEEVEVEAGALKIEAVENEVKDELSTPEKLTEIAGDAAEGKVVARLFEVTYTGEGTPESLTITFEVAGVKAGDSVVVLHKPEGADWEVITPDKVEANSVTVTLKSLSPLAILVNSNSEAATVTKSPKTGDMNLFAVELMAVAFVGVALFASKKARG